MKDVSIAPLCGTIVLDLRHIARAAKRSLSRTVEGEVVMESWRNRKTLILSRTDMMGLLTPAEYVGCVEQAYRMHGEGRYYMDPKGHIVLDKYPGEWEAMPSYIEEPEAAACKWVSIRERNREKYDLPTVFSILIYTHPATGFPLAICDGSYHTVMRTGAAAAVSAKWMARKNSTRLAIVGAGHMAEGTLATCNEVFKWEQVRIWSRSQKTLDEFVASQQPKYLGFKISTSRNLEEVVRGADVVVTVTPAREPLVKDTWIAPGTHIAAIGADKVGDQELDPAVLQRARIFVDDIRQCRTDGEINVPLAKGLIREQDIAGEIGEVITGKKQGRRTDDEITLFDSTGIALQDSATVPLEYERALAAGVGVEKKMIST
jgi:alanine dehydrogenase